MKDFFEIPKVKLDQLNVKLNVLKDSLDTWSKICLEAFEFKTTAKVRKSIICILLTSSHQTEEGEIEVLLVITVVIVGLSSIPFKGGIHGKISLTAYVVAALMETGITTEVRELPHIPRWILFIFCPIKPPLSQVF